MPNTHVLTTFYKNEGGSITVKTETITGDHSQNIELEIPPGTVNGEINMAAALSTLKAFAFGVTKKTGDSGNLTSLTIKTNSTSTPDDTLTITPANGIAWSSGDSVACPITEAITKLYVSNPGTAVANFVARFLNDSTPVLN